MILNNRLGFPVTMGKKKIWKGHFAFCCKYFSEVLRVFFFFIKKKRLNYRNRIFTLSNMETFLFWNERKVIFMEEFLLMEITPMELYFWSIVLLYCICNCEQKIQSALNFTWNILVMNVFVLQPILFHTMAMFEFSISLNYIISVKCLWTDWRCAFMLIYRISL